MNRQLDKIYNIHSVKEANQLAENLHWNETFDIWGLAISKIFNCGAELLEALNSWLKK